MTDDNKSRIKKIKDYLKDSLKRTTVVKNAIRLMPKKFKEEHGIENPKGSFRRMYEGSKLKNKVNQTREEIKQRWQQSNTYNKVQKIKEKKEEIKEKWQQSKTHERIQKVKKGYKALTRCPYCGAEISTFEDVRCPNCGRLLPSIKDRLKTTQQTNNTTTQQTQTTQQVQNNTNELEKKIFEEQRRLLNQNKITQQVNIVNQDTTRQELRKIRCPYCGSIIKTSYQGKKIRCPYCGSIFKISL